jgi:signal transduction histidine kinase/DNA-binding response OmpR family regulator
VVGNFVNTKITLLKADASAVALRVAAAPPGELSDVFQQANAQHPDFLAFTVFNREGVVASWGQLPALTAQHPSTNEYLQKAFEGQEIISSILEEKNENGGQLRIYIYAPIDAERVLSVSIDGLIFQRLLHNSFHLWRTGSLYVLDEKGWFVATFVPEFVTKRLNIYDPDEQLVGNQDKIRWAKLLSKIAADKKESGDKKNDVAIHDFFYGEGLQGKFSLLILSESTPGWMLGAFVPLESSSVAEGRRMLLLSAAISLGISLLIVFIFSGYAARPFLLIKKQNQNLKELNEDISAANEAKSHFLANMSHEMRTPLNAIIGLTDLTLDWIDEQCKPGCVGKPECIDNLEKIVSAGSTLLNLINDILDISKINSGRFEINPVEYELAELVSDAVSQNRVRIVDKPIQFELKVHPDIPSRLFGDDLRVKQILNNLLSNAFKYTRVGTVSLEVSFKQNEGQNLWLLFEVKDTGTGILPENLGKIFKDYYQVDSEANRQIEGTGMGLPLTKHLVERMEGSVTVESVYGHGSTFKVHICQKWVSPTPIGKEKAESLSTFNFSTIRLRRNAQISRLHLPHAKVLVVDDVPINLDVAKGLMRPYGMQVDCVENGQTAVELVKEARVKYDAIFMDHMMPEMDGVEATRIIRKIDSDYARNVPIVALTANAVVGTEKMFLENGFQAFIPKPIDIVQLDWVIRQWVQDKAPKVEEAREGAKKAKTEKPMQATNEEEEGLEMENLNIGKGMARFGGNVKTYWRIVHAYAQHTSKWVEKIRTVTPETLPDYGIAVHGLKSSSRNIGAELVGDMAEALEKAAKAGDFAFVQAHHPPFVEAIQKLLDVLFEKQKAHASQKHIRSEPEAAILEALRKACESFDVEQMNQLMEALDVYEYSPGSGADLMAWLKEKAFLLEFEQMAKRLQEMKVH